MTAHKAPALADAVSDWLDAAETGTVRTRGRKPFSPATIRAVEQNYRLRLADPIGGARLDQITSVHLQDLVDELDADGVNAGTIESTMLPLRLVYRRALARGVVGVDPTDAVDLPSKDRGKRKPPAPGHAAALLATVPELERPLWAVAMLAGLRRGELLALRWEDVDLDAGVLRVRRSWDPTSRTFRDTKSVHGRRTVPITRTLRPHLAALKLASTGDLVFGDGDRPRAPRAIQERADRAWKAAGLERVTLHACRHLYASMSIAAGVNANALCTYMGHSSIAVTFDLYGHLFPGNEAEAADLQDAYLDAQFLATV